MSKRRRSWVPILLSSVAVVLSIILFIIWLSISYSQQNNTYNWAYIPLFASMFWLAWALTGRRS